MNNYILITMLHCIELSALAVQQCIYLGEYPSPCVYSVQAQKKTGLLPPPIDCLGQVLNLRPKFFFVLVISVS